MQNNNIMFVVDELAYEALGKQFDSEWSASLFLDKLKSKSIYASNMYSQAPYTEGALMGLLDGINVMDDLETLPLTPHSDNNLFESMNAAGYRLFGICMDYKYLGKDYKKMMIFRLYQGLFLRGLKKIDGHIIKSYIKKEN